MSWSGSFGSLGTQDETQLRIVPAGQYRLRPVAVMMRRRPPEHSAWRDPKKTARGVWTEALAGEFLAGLDPAARRMARHVWQAGEVGIHRSALCQRTELAPAELRSLMMRVGHALRRFQGERGLKLPRPVAANSPLQSYFVDPEFAAAANSQMFDERMRQPLGEGAGVPDGFLSLDAQGR